MTSIRPGSRSPAGSSRPDQGLATYLDTLEQRPVRQANNRGLAPRKRWESAGTRVRGRFDSLRILPPPDRDPGRQTLLAGFLIRLVAACLAATFFSQVCQGLGIVQAGAGIGPDEHLSLVTRVYGGMVLGFAGVALAASLGAAAVGATGILTTMLMRAGACGLVALGITGSQTITIVVGLIAIGGGRLLDSLDARCAPEVVTDPR